jgi:hypothetical protein
VSPTAHLLDELALYAHRPYDDEADPRPLAEPAKLQGALADMFDALVATLGLGWGDMALVLDGEVGDARRGSSWSPGGWAQIGDASA